MSVTIYGIKNCDTMKKARAWLDAHGVAYHFHDYKQDGIDKARLAGWCGKVGWDVLLNRAGTTFRKLSEAEKTNLDERRAIAERVGGNGPRSVTRYGRYQGNRRWTALSSQTKS